MKSNGFTLIELIIVIAIIGVVAAIAIPNLLTALQKSKLKATMGDMKNIGTAIESYTTDNSIAPGAGTVNRIIDLNPYLVPYYSNALTSKDGWGGLLLYESSEINGSNPENYSIISYGKNGVSNTINTANSGYKITDLDGFNNDICFSNGVFTYVSKVK